MRKTLILIFCILSLQLFSQEKIGKDYLDKKVKIESDGNYYHVSKKILKEFKYSKMWETTRDVVILKNTKYIHSDGKVYPVFKSRSQIFSILDNGQRIRLKQLAWSPRVIIAN